MLTTLVVSLLALQLKSQQAPSPVVNKMLARPAPTKVLAYVDNIHITGADVEKYLWDWKQEEILNSLVNFAIIDAAAKRLHITATPSELKTEFNNALAATKQGHPNDDPLKTLKDQGYPQSRIELTVRSIVLLDKITRLGFKPNEFVDISMIVIKPNPPTQDPKAVLQTAQTYYDQLQKGTNWATVLAESTQDANVLKDQGHLGLRALSLFPPLAAAEIRNLKPGQVTHPVQTTVGVQIFKLNSFGDTAPAGDLKQLSDQFVGQHRQEVLKKLRDQAKIVTVQ